MVAPGGSEQRSGGALVQSVARAAALLRCFEAAEGELSMTELAKATGLTVSTAHRLLKTLVDEGLLVQSPVTDRYALGPMVERLARRSWQPVGSDQATAALADLTARTGESASLGVRDGLLMVVLITTVSHHPLRFDRHPGATVPLQVSAIGKCLLAFTAGPLAEVVAELAPFPAYTAATLTSRRAVQRDLERTRERGYSVVDEEQIAGMRSIGAPILGEDGTALYGIGVQGPTSRLTDDRLDEVAREVVNTARGIQHLVQRGHLI